MTTSLRLFALVGLLAALQGVLCAGSAETFKSNLNESVEFKLYTRSTADNGEVLSVSDPQILKKSKFNPSVPTKMIVHGWLSGEKEKNGGFLLKEALLAVSDCNVILVDWSHADSVNYIGSRLLVRSLGQVVGRMIVQLAEQGGLKYADLHLVGHSLGAHIMGFAGRAAGLGAEGRITGLDPAGPLFSDDADSRLDKSNAGFVDVIHTAVGLAGYKKAIGHADFYPNGGTWIQPGCGFDLGACSHCRSYSLLLESIVSPGSLEGTQCSSWKDFKAGRCSANASAELGLGCPSTARGTFYLRTNSSPPYSKTAGRAAHPLVTASHNSGHC